MAEKLRSMFPSWDVEVLEELLVAHQGSVERTVESVLTMDAMSIDGDDTTLRCGDSGVGARLVLSSTSPRGQHIRFKLPDDFLRLPVEDFRGLSEQEERDAILAHMLQDQIFWDEVLASEEFSSHFHDDRSMRQTQANTAAEMAKETNTVMSEKFTSMSEVMKSKMRDMYMRFQVRNDAPASKDPESTRRLMESESESSDDDDLNDKFVIQRRNTDHRRSRRWSAPNTGTAAFSKKEDSSSPYNS